MNIAQSLFIIYSLLLVSTSLHPMYSFVGLIKPEYAEDQISLIQQAQDESLIVFDHKGHGEVFYPDHNGVYESVYTMYNADSLGCCRESSIFLRFDSHLDPEAIITWTYDQRRIYSVQDKDFWGHPCNNIIGGIKLGTTVSWYDYQKQYKNLHLSDDLFDLSSIPAHERHKVCTTIAKRKQIKCISSYHKTDSNILFVGHASLVTIWRINKEVAH